MIAMVYSQDNMREAVRDWERVVNRRIDGGSERADAAGGYCQSCHDYSGSLWTCQVCGKDICGACAAGCDECMEIVCPRCSDVCSICGHVVCLDHMEDHRANHSQRSLP